MKKVKSRTGVNGFTLIETLFAVLILSSGIVFITPAFFKSGGVLARLAGGYRAEILLNNLITEKEESLRNFGEINTTLSRGTEEAGGFTYTYELEIFPQDSLGRLYLLNARIAWSDYKQNRLSRVAYILR